MSPRKHAPTSIALPDDLVARLREIDENKSEAIRRALARYFATVDAARRAVPLRTLVAKHADELREAFAFIEPGETATIIHTMPYIVKEHCSEDAARLVSRLSAAERIALYENIRAKGKTK